ncbi:hypothetical protein ACFL3A_11910, partial [Pseudomonadota bacterium]
QTVVAEIYGPDEATRRQTARDMEAMFQEVEGLVDVDTYMADSYTYLQFEIDREKATRMGVSVATINRNLGMVMGVLRRLSLPISFCRHHWRCVHK